MTADAESPDRGGGQLPPPEPGPRRDPEPSHSDPAQSGGDQPPGGSFAHSDTPLDVLYGALFRPAATFKRLRCNPPWRLALAVLAVTIVTSSVAAGRDLAASLLHIGMMGGVAPASVLPLVVVGSLVFAIAGWMLAAAVFHLLASLLGGNGRVTSLLALLALANLPGIFSAPLSVFEGFLGAGLSETASFGLALWVVVLTFQAVRAVYDLSPARTAFVLVLPLIFLFASLAALLVSSMGLIMNLMPLMPGSLH